MTEPGTVILTSKRPGLATAMTRAWPGLRITEAAQGAPDECIDGHVWCFIDWLLPDTSGLEMCRRLRSAPATTNSYITMVLDEGDSEARRGR